MVVTSEGIYVIELDLVEHLCHQASLAARPSDLVFCNVHLPNDSHDLYLLASWTKGHEAFTLRSFRP